MLGYSWEWWLTEALPGLAAISSLILVIYYAKLARQNKEQTKAVQAGYTPSLDVRYHFDNNELVLEVVNRGQGTAKHVEFMMEVEFRDEEKRAYVVQFDNTLPTNHALRWNDSAPLVRTKPIIYNLEDDTKWGAH